MGNYHLHQWSHLFYIQKHYWTYLKHYGLKPSIQEPKITIENALKIRMLKNISLAFKTYLIIINDQMQKDKKWEENKVLFKTIKEEKTYIKAENKASANFA